MLLAEFIFIWLLTQGFQKFYKVADMVVKASDVKFVFAPQGALRALNAQAPRGFWEHAPQEMLKIEHSETPFPAFLKQGWSSLKFSLKSKIIFRLISKGKKNNVVVLKNAIAYSVIL